MSQEENLEPKVTSGPDLEKKSIDKMHVDNYEMGKRLVQLDLLDKALIWFSGVTKSHPHYLDALLEKAFILLQREQYFEVGKICEILLKAQPENADAYFLKGVISRNEKQALTFFDNAIEFGGRSHCAAESLYRKGMLLEQRKELDKALECYKNALAIYGKNERISSSIEKIGKKINLIDDSLRDAVGRAEIKEVKKIMAQGAKPGEKFIPQLSRMLERLNTYATARENYLAIPYHMDSTEKYHRPFPLEEPPYDASDIEKILEALNLSNEYSVKMVFKKTNSFGLRDFEYQLSKVQPEPTWEASFKRLSVSESLSRFDTITSEQKKGQSDDSQFDLKHPAPKKQEEKEASGFQSGSVTQSTGAAQAFSAAPSLHASQPAFFGGSSGSSVSSEPKIEESELQLPTQSGHSMSMTIHEE